MMTKFFLKKNSNCDLDPKMLEGTPVQMMLSH